MKRRRRELEQAATGTGRELRQTRSGHFALVDPSGRRPAVFTASTPSDRNDKLILARKLRAAERRHPVLEQAAAPELTPSPPEPDRVRALARAANPARAPVRPLWLPQGGGLIRSHPAPPPPPPPMWEDRVRRDPAIDEPHVDNRALAVRRLQILLGIPEWLVTRFSEATRGLPRRTRSEGITDIADWLLCNFMAPASAVTTDYTRRGHFVAAMACLPRGKCSFAVFRTLEERDSRQPALAAVAPVGTYPENIRSQLGDMKFPAGDFWLLTVPGDGGRLAAFGLRRSVDVAAFVRPRLSEMMAMVRGRGGSLPPPQAPEFTLRHPGETP